MLQHFEASLSWVPARLEAGALTEQGVTALQGRAAQQVERAVNKHMSRRSGLNVIAQQLSSVLANLVDCSQMQRLSFG